MNSIPPCEYDVQYAPGEDRALLPDHYRGCVFRISNRWEKAIPFPSETDDPLSILDLSTQHGANACSLVKTYATHPYSRIFCVDPWMDFSSYADFIHNLSCLSPEDVNKIQICRGNIEEQLMHCLPDESMDIVYLNGIYDKYSLIQIMLLCHKKCKSGGWIIFNDVQHKEVANTITLFTTLFVDEIQKIQLHSGQVFIQFEKQIEP